MDKSESASEIFNIIDNLQKRLDKRTKMIHEVDEVSVVVPKAEGCHCQCKCGCEVIRKVPKMESMNDFYIRKIIKEEFAAMIAPFQIEMHSRITNVDNKVNMVTNSVAVMNNNFLNNNNNSVRISQIDNEGYEAKIKELDEKIDLLVNYTKNEKKENFSQEEFEKINEKIRKLERNTNKEEFDEVTKGKIKELCEIDINELKDISNIKSEVSKLKTTLFSVQLNMKSNEEDNSEIPEKIDNNTSNINEERIKEEIKKQSDMLENQIREINRKLTENQNQIQKQIQTQTQFQNQIQNQIQSQIQAQIQNVPQNQNKNENKSQNQEEIEKRLSEIENKLFIIDNTQNDYALKTEIENFKKDMERIKESIQKYDDEISQLITQYAEMKTKIYTIESSANKPVVEEREPEKEKSPIKESPAYKTDIFDDLNKEEKKEPTREPPSLKEKINNDDDFDDFDVEDIDEL